MDADAGREMPWVSASVTREQSALINALRASSGVEDDVLIVEELTASRVPFPEEEDAVEKGGEGAK